MTRAHILNKEILFRARESLVDDSRSWSLRIFWQVIICFTTMYGNAAFGQHKIKEILTTKNFSYLDSLMVNDYGYEAGWIYRNKTKDGLIASKAVYVESIHPYNREAKTYFEVRVVADGNSILHWELDEYIDGKRVPVDSYSTAQTLNIFDESLPIEQIAFDYLISIIHEIRYEMADTIPHVFDKSQDRIFIGLGESSWKGGHLGYIKPKSTLVSHYFQKDKIFDTTGTSNEDSDSKRVSDRVKRVLLTNYPFVIKSGQSTRDSAGLYDIEMVFSNRFYYGGYYYVRFYLLWQNVSTDVYIKIDDRGKPVKYATMSAIE